MFLLLASLFLYLSTKPASWPPERYAKLPAHDRVLFAVLSIEQPTPIKIAQVTMLSSDAAAYWVTHWRNNGFLEESDPLRLTPKGHNQAVLL